MKHGFALIELVFAAFLVALGLYGAFQCLKPINQANKKMHLQNVMQSLENDIRRGIFYQDNYTLGTFQITNANDIVIARSGESLFINTRLDHSSPVLSPEHPIEVKMQYESFFPMGSTDSQNAIIYQIKLHDAQFKMDSLGVQEWPVDVPAYMVDNFSTRNQILEIPTELVDSLSQNCNSGFLRGFRNLGAGNLEKVCWEVQAPTGHSRAIPTGLSLINATSSIQIEFTTLNNVSCPTYEIPTFTGASKPMPNMYVLKELYLSDLFPPRTGTSQHLSCQKVIDFNLATRNGEISIMSFSNGVIPSTLVNDSTVNSTGNCPDPDLYTKNPANGDCNPNFNLSSIPERLPANIAP